MSPAAVLEVVVVVDAGASVVVAGGAVAVVGSDVDEEVGSVETVVLDVVDVRSDAVVELVDDVDAGGTLATVV